MKDLIQREMTLEEAQETDRLIKRHITTTRYLLLDMRDRKGWKHLGYESFDEYGKTQLHYEKAHLHRLANAAEVEKSLESPIGDKIPERQLRALAQVPAEERKRICLDRKGVGRRSRQARGRGRSKASRGWWSKLKFSLRKENLSFPRAGEGWKGWLPFPGA